MVEGTLRQKTYMNEWFLECLMYFIFFYSIYFYLHGCFVRNLNGRLFFVKSDLLFFCL